MYIKSDTFGSDSNFDHLLLCTLFNQVRDCETLATWQQANDSSAEALMPYTGSYPRRLNLPGWLSPAVATSNTTPTPNKVYAVGNTFTIRRLKFIAHLIRLFRRGKDELFETIVLLIKTLAVSIDGFSFGDFSSAKGPVFVSLGLRGLIYISPNIRVGVVTHVLSGNCSRPLPRDSEGTSNQVLH